MKIEYPSRVKFRRKLRAMETRLKNPDGKPTPLVRLYRDMVVDRQPSAGALLSMRGNPKAAIMVIAPPFSSEDFAIGIPFSDDVGRMITAAFDSIGFTEDRYILVSCQRHGDWTPGKVLKKDFYHPIELFIKECALKGYIDRFVAIGGVPFQYIFGRGKKPAMETICGAQMPMAEFDHRQVMVMPNSHGLIYKPSDDRKEDFVRQRISKELTASYNKLLPKLKGFVE